MAEEHSRGRAPTRVGAAQHADPAGQGVASEVGLGVSVDELVELLEALVELSLAARDFEVEPLVEAGAGSEVVTDCSALDVDWLVDDVGGSVGVGSAAVVVVVVDVAGGFVAVVGELVVV